MALTAEQLKKYGLTESDATSANHDKGIVGVGDSFYSINDFERQQREGKDTDQGASFDSSLYKDAQAEGFSVKNFNTATDVEGALEALYGAPKEETTSTEDPNEPIVYSPRLAHSRAIVAQANEDLISGQRARDMYGQNDDPANTFLNRYKLKLGERLSTGYYVKPDQAVTNNSKVASGANGSSVDAAHFAKTGEDNRFNDPAKVGAMSANVLL